MENLRIYLDYNRQHKKETKKSEESKRISLRAEWNSKSVKKVFRGKKRKRGV
jgi:hypothetical protein